LANKQQNLIDRFSDATGKLTAWLTLLMVITTVVVVVLRYVFDVGLIWLQESIIWMHATVFMVGAAYALMHEEHVRVDVFYRSMSVRRKALVDLLGVAIFLLPMCVLLAVKSYDFAWTSWAMHEASRESGGLPYPFLPIIKSVLIIMPVTVGLQGLALLLRSVRNLRGPA
jgi:TRAP-type mannitol/chloroaromatic compound transport system permease small subunit